MELHTDLIGKTAVTKNLVGADREVTIRAAWISRADDEDRVHLLVSACDGGMWVVPATDAKLKKACEK